MTACSELHQRRPLLKQLRFAIDSSLQLLQCCVCAATLVAVHYSLCEHW
jgi:hypothetical protein